MKLDVTIHEGERKKPVVIFIHGLGMDKDIWINPLNTKVLAKNIPLRVLAAKPPGEYQAEEKKGFSIGEVPEKIQTLWDTLKEEGFNLLCWSQSRPVGPIGVAVEELAEVMEEVKRLFPETPLALIGHSRGGLVARKFMEINKTGIKALITISTPNAGSRISSIGKYLSPLSALLKDILPQNTHGTISEIIKNIRELVEGNALGELLPGSDFFKNLKDSFIEGVSYISFGGTDPRILTIYKWKREDKRNIPYPMLSIPHSLLKIFPPSFIPEEILPGSGDLLVSTKSSLLPWASRHYNLAANHFSIMWHEKTIDNTVSVLRGICG